MEYVESIGIKSVIVMPIVSGSSKIGVAYFNYNEDFHVFREDEVRLVTTVARQIASGIEAKRTAAMAREAEAQRNRIYEMSLDMLGTAGFDGYFKDLNPSWEKTLGFSPEELMAEPFISFVHPDDVDATMAEAAKLSEGVEVLNFVNRYRTKDGHWRWLSWNSTQDYENELIYFVTHDITDEIAARQQRDRFYTVSIDLIGVATFAGYFVDLNPAWNELLDYTDEELKAEPFISFVHPDDVDATMAEAAKLAEGVETFNFTNRYRKKDGSYVWLSWNSTPDYESELIYFTARDITEELAREQAIVARANQLQTVSEVATEASNTLDLDVMLQNVVDLAKERFGLYHAHIYLLEDDELVLAAGADDNGRRMKAAGHHISLKNENSIVATAARTKEPVRSNDVMSNISFLPNPLLPRTRAELAVPLIYNRNVIGVFDIQDDTPNRFSDEDETIQQILAGQIATAIQNAVSFEAAQQRASQLAIVSDVATQAANTLDLDEMLQNVVDLTKAQFSLYHAHIYLLEGEQLVLAAGSDDNGRRMRNSGHRISLRNETSIVASAARAGKAVRANDVTSNPAFLPNPLLPRTRSELAVTAHL